MPTNRREVRLTPDIPAILVIRSASSKMAIGLDKEKSQLRTYPINNNCTTIRVVAITKVFSNPKRKPTDNPRLIKINRDAAIN
jgi:hypothetical protein